MLCNRLFDFVTGTEIFVPPPSIRSPLWDIVRPNEAATDLLAAHAEVLRETDTPRDADNFVDTRTH